MYGVVTVQDSHTDTGCNFNFSIAGNNGDPVSGRSSRGKPRNMRGENHHPLAIIGREQMLRVETSSDRIGRDCGATVCELTGTRTVPAEAASGEGPD